MKKLIALIALSLVTTPAFSAVNLVKATVINKIHIPSSEKTVDNNVLIVKKNDITAERWLVLMTIEQWGGSLNTMDSKELYDKVEIGQLTTLSYDVVLSMGAQTSCTYQINNIALPDGKVVKIWDNYYGR